MGYNKFSGLQEPDAELDKIKGEIDIEAFRNAVVEIDKIRGAENEAELIQELVLLAMRYNDTRIKIDTGVDYPDAISQLEDVYTEHNATMLVQALAIIRDKYDDGTPYKKVDEDVLYQEAKYKAKNSQEDNLKDLTKYFNENPEEMLDWLESGIKGYELNQKAIEQLEASKSVEGYSVKVRRGEVYWCELLSAVGSEQSGGRTVLILSNDAHNKFSPTVNVVVMDGDFTKPNYQVKIEKKDLSKGVLPRNRKEVAVLITNIITIDKARLGNRVCKVDEKKMQEIEERIIKQLGILEETCVSVLKKQGYKIEKK